MIIDYSSYSTGLASCCIKIDPSIAILVSTEHALRSFYLVSDTLSKIYLLIVTIKY